MSETLSTRDEILKSVSRLHAAPPTGFKLMRLLRDPNFHQSDVIDLIKYDSALCAEVIRFYRSAAANLYSPGTEPDLFTIVLRMGYKNVVEKVVQLSVQHFYLKPVSGYGIDPIILWNHSIETAVACRALSKWLSIEEDPAYLSGLLHDIGKAVLNMVPIANVVDLQKLVEVDQLPRSVAERTVLGIDHAEIGSNLLEKWGVMPMVISGTYYHNDPHEDPSGCARMIFLAHILAHEMFPENSGAVTSQTFEETWVEFYGHTHAPPAPHELDNLRAEIHATSLEIKELFKK